MYLEGMGFRAIGRALKISHVTVFQWINQLGQNMELPKRQEAIAVVELDEMHTYDACRDGLFEFGGGIH
jgi:DNA-binding NarL/FixJ family response regulator